MLLYENEGFLEAETSEISQLCRSTLAITLEDAEQGKYELEAILCDYQDKTEQRCRIAFYVKSLKRALVFAVPNSEKTPAWQYGQEALAQLGFKLESVNLKLSPAMLEVVLRDVPGLATPAEAHNHRKETQRLIAEFQETYEQKPESGQGKKAALKLSAEKRLSERTEKLRHLLEALFSSKETVNDDMEALLAQVKDLTERLAAAEADAESERSQREMSESITAAAEKRIRELETVLVDVETQSSNKLKQKRRVVELQNRINELDAELVSAVTELESEREKQTQFIDDVKAANEQIVDLEHALKAAEVVREEALTELSEQDCTELKESLREAELRVKVLGKELERAEKKTAQCDDAVKASAEVQTLLAEAQQALSEALDSNKQLEEELASVVEQSKDLQRHLENAERERQPEALAQEERLALTDQYAQLVEEHKSLSEEFDQERSIRKRLEKGSVGDERRISDLETALANKELSLEKALSKEASGGPVDEIANIERELEERLQCLELEQEARQELEKELHDAHKMINSFEKMIQETETSEGGSLHENSTMDDSGKVRELEDRLHCLEAQLEAERIEQKRLAKELSDIEKKSVGQDVSPAGMSVEQKDKATSADVAKASPQKSSKPLPHELRPAPKKGAFFCPDWNLEGLPCRSTDQVLKAWETVFNVQISLEGYPAQYCMAFLVLLRRGKQKKIFMLYRLKKNKHTLVCVPTKKPKDEASLQKVIKKGLDFLRKSGFEMDEMPSEHVERTLGGYFLEAD